MPDPLQAPASNRVSDPGRARRGDGPWADQFMLPDAAVSVLGMLPDGVVVTDHQGRIAYVNSLLERISGYRAADLIGQSIETLVPADRREEHATFRIRYGANGLPRRPMDRGLDITLRRRDGTAMHVDIALSAIDVAGEPMVLAAVRDMTTVRKTEARMRAANEVANSILSGGDTDALMHQVARTGLKLVGGESAFVAVPHGGGYAIRAAAGAHSEELLGTFVVEGAEVIDAALEHGRGFAVRTDGATRVPLANLGHHQLESYLVAPLWVRGDPFGALAVLTTAGAKALDEDDLREVEAFAAQAALAVHHASVRDELARLQVVEERERIARGLHDTVIQHLFAMGLRLQAADPAGGSTLDDRVARTIDDLDAVIREIRATILALDSPRSGGLRSEIVATVHGWTDALGFEPKLRITGPVDALVPSEARHHVVTTIHEGLANAARHAHASRIEVTVACDGGTLGVTVSDNGHGVGAATSRAGSGMGLRNLTERARSCGGRCSLVDLPAGGAELRWQIPLAQLGTAIRDLQS